MATLEEPTAPTTEVLPSLSSSTDEAFRAWVTGPVTAELPKRLSQANWLAWGKQLQSAGHRVGWKLAFWLAYGENRWGETYIQIATDLGVSKDLLYHAAGVARAFANLALAPDLTISHGRELAHSQLQPDERQTLAETVSARRLSTKETRHLVAEFLKAQGRPLKSDTQPAWNGGDGGRFGQAAAVAAAQLPAASEEPAAAEFVEGGPADPFGQNWVAPTSDTLASTQQEVVSEAAATVPDPVRSNGHIDLEATIERGYAEIRTLRGELQVSLAQNKTLVDRVSNLQYALDQAAADQSAGPDTPRRGVYVSEEAHKKLRHLCASYNARHADAVLSDGEMMEALIDKQIEAFAKKGLLLPSREEAASAAAS